MTLEPASYRRHRFPAEIISHAVICDLDLTELQAIIPPRGFGRD